MKNILLISGKMQSGKSSIVKFLYGYKMRQLGIINKFGFTPEGDLLIPVKNSDEFGVFDIFRTDEQFIEFLYGSGLLNEIYRYSFADQLKAACAQIFGIDPELFKTDAGKNTETHIKWENFMALLDAPTKKKLKAEGIGGNMTVRQVLQYFGTQVCRKIDDDCWVRSTWDAVSNSMSKTCVIDDCRFPNEFYYFKERGAKTIRLGRDIKHSTNISETAMDDIPESEYDLFLDNSSMTMYEKNTAVLNYLGSIQWLTGTI